ncbi:PREDICTED: uncharacterized protein LOC104807584 [Tarenaya hassleriana]|uniref:uncharacterized protein LOC104807584 n=1 Tax=Tarenaya hassleriana TaxID=28532 RepID=UPI00053C935D|nr:PREDICTED: uncharacterized protein LOC104807584 [Tarenaya hassleriana]
MKKTSASSNSLGAFLSPGAPSHGDTCSIYNKGWSSERVPHPSTAGINGRRHISSASALATPFYSGRALPSKWEDAERWICSPLASYPAGVCKNSCVNSRFVEQRRPKSKSGPIVPPPLLPPSSSSSATGCYHYSPTAAMRAVEAPPGSMRGLTVVGSPFSTGVLEADRVFRGSVGGGGGCDGHDHGWIDLVSESSSSSSKDKKQEDGKEGEMALSPVVSRRDMATQMSPDATSPNQSPGEREASPVVVSVIEPQNGSLCRQQEVREVKIDRRARMIKHPKRRVCRVSKREPPEVEDDVYMNSGASGSLWDISEPAMSLSKLQREEAKIAAWENLQKAKAEAAIRKLEVKLEKKKSESMDKIMNKLQTAQHRAQEMRSSMPRKDGYHISKNTLKLTNLVRRNTFINPFMSCFAPRVDCRTPSSL